MCACVKPATHIYKEVHFENKGQFALGIAMIGGKSGGCIKRKYGRVEVCRQVLQTLKKIFLSLPCLRRENYL